MSVRFGADRLAADPTLLPAVRRVALATNDAARTSLDVAVTTRAALQAAGVPPGLVAAEDRFVPGVDPDAGQSCAAVRLDVADPRRVRPVAAGLALLADLASSYAGTFEWRGYPTAANPSGDDHLERLVGSTAVAAALRADPDAATDDVIAGWVAAPGWAARWRSVQLYSP